MLGTKISDGFSALVKKYGSFVGLWLGPTRTVLITDFDTLQDILNLQETAVRDSPVETGGKCSFYFTMSVVASIIILKS